jgi:hypothetical protein
MKIISWVAVAIFGFSLNTAIVLGMLSRDYSFIPDSQISENNSQNGKIDIPSEKIDKLWRTSGNLDPGNVEIQVLYLNPIQKIDNEKLIFQIALNTHSVDLSNYDITKKVVLEDSSGRTIKDGFYWEPVHGNQSHHLMGILVVPIKAKGQRNKFPSGSDNTDWIKLTIKGIPQIEIREFLWDKGLS